jgi:alkylhydroperoxidase family enzyme
MQPQSIEWLLKADHTGGLPQATLEMVHTRVKQLNGLKCGVDEAVRKPGINNEMVAAWREVPSYFDAPELAALALAESATQLAGTPDPVPADIWEEAARHFDDKGLAALILAIATTNLLNHVNVTTQLFEAAL